MAGSDSNSSTSSTSATAAAPPVAAGSLVQNLLRWFRPNPEDILKKDMRNTAKELESECRNTLWGSSGLAHDLLLAASDENSNTKRFNALWDYSVPPINAAWSSSAAPDVEDSMPEAVEVVRAHDKCECGETRSNFAFRAAELLRKEQAASLKSPAAAAAYILKNTDEYGLETPLDMTVNTSGGRRGYSITGGTIQNIPGKGPTHIGAVINYCRVGDKDISGSELRRFRDEVRPALEQVVEGTPMTEDQLSEVDNYFEKGSCEFRFGHCTTLQTMFSHLKPKPPRNILATAGLYVNLKNMEKAGLLNELKRAPGL